MSTPTFLLVLSICLMAAAIAWVLFLVVLMKRNPDYGKGTDFDRDDTTIYAYSEKTISKRKDLL